MKEQLRSVGILRGLYLILALGFAMSVGVSAFAMDDLEDVEMELDDAWSSSEAIRAAEQQAAERAKEAKAENTKAIAAAKKSLLEAQSAIKMSEKKIEEYKEQHRQAVIEAEKQRNLKAQADSDKSKALADIETAKVKYQVQQNKVQALSRETQAAQAKMGLIQKDLLEREANLRVITEKAGQLEKSRNAIVSDKTKLEKMAKAQRAKLGQSQAAFETKVVALKTDIEKSRALREQAKDDIAALRKEDLLRKKQFKQLSEEQSKARKEKLKEQARLKKYQKTLPKAVRTKVAKDAVKRSNTAGKVRLLEKRAKKNCNIRSGPGTNFGTIGKLKVGNKYGISNAQNGWHKILTSNGINYTSKICF